MRVSSNSESLKTEKPEKKTMKKSHVATASAPEKEKKDDDGDTKVKLSSKAKAKADAKEPKAHKASKAEAKAEAKTESKVEPKLEAKAEPKAEPTHEPKAPAASANGPSDKELKEAETLMSHVNSGKLGEDERDMALKRVGNLLKRYGNA